MKIAILGTRGIPNRYGGFERFAERLAKFLVEKGIDVTVYNPDTHPYKQREWERVQIERIFSMENKLGVLGNFIFDYLSLKDALKKQFNIILELGYAPSSLFYFLKKRKKSIIITNMDGLEWKREKWNIIAKVILKKAESIAVKKSNILVADNIEIKNYIWEKYKKESVYIPYGADLFQDPDEGILKKNNLKKNQYFLVIARFEPENNLEKIILGYKSAQTTIPLVLIGNYRNSYGLSLYKKYRKCSRIIFKGAIYDKLILDNLRYFSKIYFHGHSVGGTNPSLLEAMAAKAFIVAHDNVFNRSILENDALYFKSSNDIKNILLNVDNYPRNTFIKNNEEKIVKKFNWKNVLQSYLKLFEGKFK